MTAVAANTRSGSKIPWLIIICGCLIAAMTFGPRSAMGFFQLPMLAEKGWDRTTFGLAMAIQNLCWGLGQPVFGAIADRFGSWRVLTLGAVLYSLGLYLMAHADSATMLHLSGGVLVGLGVAAGSFSIVLAAFAPQHQPAEPLDGVRHRHRRRFRRHVHLRPDQPGSDRRLWLVRHARLHVDRHAGHPGAGNPACRQCALGQGLAGRGRADARSGAVRGLRPQELPAADLGLLRLRLPGRLHHRPLPGLYQGHRHRRALRRDRAGADRLLQRHRLARLGRHRPEIFQAALPRLDLYRPARCW